MDTMSKEVWACPYGTEDSDMFSPIDRGGNYRPLCCISICNLNQCFADIIVLLFNDTSRLRVVSRNVYVIYTVSFCQYIKGFAEGGTI